MEPNISIMGTSYKCM